MYVSPATINESPRRSKRPEAGQKSERSSHVVMCWISGCDGGHEGTVHDMLTMQIAIPESSPAMLSTSIATPHVLFSSTLSITVYLQSCHMSLCSYQLLHACSASASILPSIILRHQRACLSQLFLFVRADCTIKHYSGLHQTCTMQMLPYRLALQSMLTSNHIIHPSR